MAEANFGPPESAADESGSGEEQKEEKQGDDEGDRAFEVILLGRIVFQSNLFLLHQF